MSYPTNSTYISLSKDLLKVTLGLEDWMSLLKKLNFMLVV